MLTSGKAYDIMRDFGLICLPSKCTLRDYIHWHKIKPGFDVTVINHLREEAQVDTLADWQKSATIVHCKYKNISSLLKSLHI